MVRTVKNHLEDEEEDDEEFVLRSNDASSQNDKKRSDRKANAHRSKHSETEQRRRSKINERFQNLRDLIPENDQKRDKASFLLEVIQYIQFLQEKLQLYEGTYQGWSTEPSKLMPRRGNFGAVESFIDQSQLIKSGSVDEDSIALTPALLRNAENLVESDLSGSASYKSTDNGAAVQAGPLNMPLQSNLFEVVSAQPPQGSFYDAEHLAFQSRPQPWNGRPCTTECSIPSYTPNEQEELKMESEEATITNAYSQGLLNTLTDALGTSGVDLSQASISVQLDVRSRTSSGATAASFGNKDHESLSPGHQTFTHNGVGSSGEVCHQAHKRLRTEQG